MKLKNTKKFYAYDILNGEESIFTASPYFISTKSKEPILLRYQLNNQNNNYLGDLPSSDAYELNDEIFILTKTGYILTKTKSDMNQALEICSDKNKLSNYKIYSAEKKFISLLAKIPNVNNMNINSKRYLNNKLKSILNEIGNFSQNDKIIGLSATLSSILKKYSSSSSSEDSTISEELIRKINYNLEKIMKDLSKIEKYVEETEQKKLEAKLAKVIASKLKLKAFPTKQFNLSFKNLGLKSKQDVCEMFFALTGVELKWEHKDWILGLKTEQQLLEMNSQDLIDSIMLFNEYKRIWRTEIENIYKEELRNYELSSYEKSKLERVSEMEYLPWEKIINWSL